ncbi:MAG: thermonuclease family protein [Burkholderiales bacterium]|nr:thermonuclease family protein [Burkholderiales bacterium]
MAVVGTRGVATHGRALAIIVALVASLQFSQAVGADWLIEGRVVRVSDGDTVTVLDDEKKQHKIRFAGIDAPEKRQPFGNASKQNLSRLIFDRRVEARCHKRDRYGREVCAVLIDARDIGLEQVRAGMAWHYKRFESEQTPQARVEFADAEGRARTARRGLWADKNPTPPWEWRDKSRARR